MLREQAQELATLAAELQSAATSERAAIVAAAAAVQLLSALRHAEEEAADKLADLQKCIEGAASQAKACNSKRAKLASERAQAEERAAVAVARLPELEAEKKAAAASKVGCIDRAGAVA